MILWCLDTLHGYTWFSTLDLSSGFWQLPLETVDVKKTAFVANDSLCQFLSMPYGVVNGPLSFTRLMHMVLKGIPRCLWYIDDAIIFSRSFEEHIKAVQKFLGFCVFYHCFLKNLSDVVKSLYRLWKKNLKFEWTTEADMVFKQLKEAIASLPILALPDPNKSFDLHTDASNVGIGAALVQEDRPIAFASRTLSTAEVNYSTTEKECLVIVWALDYFYPYLYGGTFTIFTDHAALKSILSTKTPRGRISRWIPVIQSYQFTIVHRKGILNTDADALSRLPEEVSPEQSLEELSIQGFQALQNSDSYIQLFKREVKAPFLFMNGLLCYKKDSRSVPALPQTLVTSVLKKYHEGSLGGNFGIDKTLNTNKQVAYWPNMKEDITQYIKSCHACQIYKVRQDSTIPPMKPILPRFTGDIWAMDVVKLPLIKNGDRYILVRMENLSKWVTSNQVAQIILFEVCLKYGVPNRLISDNGANLVSDAMNMVYKRIGIKRPLTSVEHPQTNGLVERANRTLKTSLATYTGKEEKDRWDEYLPFATFAYNTSKQASTGFSLFEILVGRKTTLPLLEDLRLEDVTTYKTETYLNNHLPNILDRYLIV